MLRVEWTQEPLHIPCSSRDWEGSAPYEEQSSCLPLASLLTCSCFI